jgi:two-component system, OmpR family, response regulator
MRILVVEDEPDLLRALAKALREEGYAVDVAEDGDVGLQKAEGTDYDAIVLDVMLPVIDGFELLRRLRLTKSTPVLILTARGKSGDRVRGLDTGADDYLAKPYDLDELLARLRALIRRAAEKTKGRTDSQKQLALNLASRSNPAHSNSTHDPKPHPPCASPASKPRNITLSPTTTVCPVL